MSNAGRQPPPGMLRAESPPIAGCWSKCPLGTPSWTPLSLKLGLVWHPGSWLASASLGGAPLPPLKIPGTSRLKDRYSYAHTPWSTGMALDQ